jgi:hypothetical protein
MKKICIDNNNNNNNDNNNNNNIIKDNILLNVQNKFFIIDDINFIKQKQKTIVIHDNKEGTIHNVKDTNLLVNKEDDIFDNSQKRHREDLNTTILNLDIINKN